MLDLSEIEQGIKDAISNLNRPYITEVASYGGEFDDNLPEAVRRFPAVWVTFGTAGRPRRFTAKQKWLVPVTFVVLVGARNLRNEEATRHGVKINGQLVEIGTYQLINDVNAALLGNDLGITGMDAFEPGTVKTLFNTKLEGQALSVLAMEWHTRFELKKPEPDEPWLLRVGMDFLTQPSDETPDFHAEVELEGDEGPFADGSHEGSGFVEAG